MRMKPSVRRKNIPTLGIPLSHWDGGPFNWGIGAGISNGQTQMRMYTSKTASHSLSTSVPVSRRKPKEPQGYICISFISLQRPLR